MGKELNIQGQVRLSQGRFSASARVMAIAENGLSAGEQSLCPETSRPVCPISSLRKGTAMTGLTASRNRGSDESPQEGQR